MKSKTLQPYLSVFSYRQRHISNLFFSHPLKINVLKEWKKREYQIWAVRPSTFNPACSVSEFLKNISSEGKKSNKKGN